MSQTLLNIPVYHLLEYAKQTQTSGELYALKISTLTGGYAAVSVYRLDMDFKGTDNFTSFSFVQKYTHANEVQVMRLLTKNFNIDALPSMIDGYLDIENPQQNGASWFISPFYEGHLLAFDDDMPLSVVKALASVHSFFSKNTSELETLLKLDADYITSLLNLIFTRLDENTARLSESLIAEVKRELNAANCASVLGKIFERLPKTLTHGDMHPGNIIHTAKDTYIVFDWGNARLAPAMLDLANMVNIDSDEWRVYVDHWKEITGVPLDVEQTRMGYDWAVAVVNLQYLPFAIGYLEPDSVQEMLDKVTSAIATLQKSL